MSLRKAVSSPSKGPGDLEGRLAAATQQLEATRKLYQRLHAHNDEMEVEFCRLQDVLLQVRHTAAAKVAREAASVRSELTLMREAVQFYTATWQREFKSQQRMIMTALGAAAEVSQRSAQRSVRARTPDPVHRALLQAFGEKVHGANVVDVPPPAKRKKAKKRAETVDGGEVKEEPGQDSSEDAAGPMTSTGASGPRQMTKDLQKLEAEKAELMQRLLQQEEIFAKQLMSIKLSHKETVATMSTQIKMLTGLLASRNMHPGDAPPLPTVTKEERDDLRDATNKLMLAHKRHLEQAKAQQTGMPELATAARAAERAQGSAVRATTPVPARPPAPVTARASPARTLAEQGLWAERELRHRSSSGTPQRHAFVISADYNRHR